MATLTTQQRTTALAHLLYAASLDPSAETSMQAIPGVSSATLAQLLPGVSPTQIINALVTAIGAQFDTQLSTVLTNMVAAAQAVENQASAEATAMQNLITTL